MTDSQIGVVGEVGADGLLHDIASATWDGLSAKCTTKPGTVVLRKFHFARPLWTCYWKWNRFFYQRTTVSSRQYRSLPGSSTAHIVSRHASYSGWKNLQYWFQNNCGWRGRIVHSQGEVTFDEQNNPVRAKGTVQDITEHKKSRRKDSEPGKHSGIFKWCITESPEVLLRSGTIG